MENESEIEKLARMVQNDFTEMHQEFAAVHEKIDGVEKRLDNVSICSIRKSIALRPRSTSTGRRPRTASPLSIASSAACPLRSPITRSGSKNWKGSRQAEGRAW